MGSLFDEKPPIRAVKRHIYFDKRSLEIVRDLV
jgi:hypothetical protein